MVTKHERVLERVDDEGAVRLAEDLIRIPSFSGEEAQVAAFLEGFFRERGYEVEVMEVEQGRFQPVARLRGAGGGPSLMFNGHMDVNITVLGWRREPFRPTIEGDRLYGAGARNMKGGLAAMIMAAEAVREAGVELRGDLVVAPVVGELQGGVGTHHLVTRGILTDMAVVAEPYPEMCITHAGVAYLAISTVGSSEHHTRRGAGTVDAIEKMVGVMGALRGIRWRQRPFPRLPNLPKMNIGSIIGGLGRDYRSDASYVSDLCTIVLDVRYPPGMTDEEVKDEVEAVLEELAAADPELRYELQIGPPPHPFFRYNNQITMPPLDLAEEEPIVQTVRQNFVRIMGREPRLQSSEAGNDTGHLWRAGVPCCLLGPESGTEHHDEWVSLPHLEKVTRILALTAVDICT